LILQEEARLLIRKKNQTTSLFFRIKALASCLGLGLA
jgi:hypothetical protein